MASWVFRAHLIYSSQVAAFLQALVGGQVHSGRNILCGGLDLPAISQRNGEQLRDSVPEESSALQMLQQFPHN